MTEGEAQPLLDEGAAVLAAVDAFLKRSEDRAAYRQEHGRSLSAQHKEALGELVMDLDRLRDRLRVILEPAPTVEDLKREFEAAIKRLEELP